MLTPLFSSSSETVGSSDVSESMILDRKAFTSNPRLFVDLMDRHKALLIQSGQDFNPNSDVDVLSTEDFGCFVADLQLEKYPYVGGAAPRRIIPVKAGDDIIFTANER